MRVSGLGLYALSTTTKDDKVNHRHAKILTLRAPLLSKPWDFDGTYNIALVFSRTLE